MKKLVMPCPTAHFLNKSGVKIQEFSARTGTTKLRETAATQEYDEVLGVDLIPFLPATPELLSWLGVEWILWTSAFLRILKGSPSIW